MFKRFMLLLVVACSLFAAVSFPTMAQTPEQIEARAIGALAQWVRTTTKNQVSVPESEGIVAAAYRYGKFHNVDPLIVLSIIRSESTFNRKASAKHGSRGLMQVIPYWHRDKLKGRDIYNTAVNIDVGTQVFDKCMVKTKDVVRAALFCYRGAKDVKYVSKIAATHQSIRTFLVEYEIANEHPVSDTVAFSHGRFFSDTQHLATAPAGDHA